MTWWPFGRGTFLDPDDEEWQVETWRWFLGSGLIDHIQKMTVAAMQMADMKVWAHLS